jgi:hypothetical protein
VCPVVRFFSTAIPLFLSVLLTDSLFIAALFSRQFVEISRSRIEGLLTAFPKLMSQGGKQHTFIETDSVRYLYQPLESLYVVVVTNRGSNILDDLQTLHLFARLVRVLFFLKYMLVICTWRILAFMLVIGANKYHV